MESFAIVVLGLAVYFGARKAVVAWRGAAARTEPLPVGLRAKLQSKYPQYSRAQIDDMLDGLRDWFVVARLAKKRFVSMPSQAVDAAWHEFILFTQAYDRFCKRTLGRFLHHVPAEAMRTRTRAQEGMRRTWRLACAMEGIDPKRPSRLPRLFALDAALAFPGGFVYTTDCARGGQTANGDAFCASHIGCSSGCGAGSDGSHAGDGHGSTSDGGGDSGGDGGGGGCGGGD